MDVSAMASAVTSQRQGSVQAERTILVLKQAQDAAKIQARALADLVTTTTEQIGRHINVYA
jgi:hypothetical protein